MADNQYFFDSDVNNDIVDIYAIPDAKSKILKKSDDFCIELSGKAIDYSIVNSIRRTVLQSIPIYGFNRAHITIDKKNKCMYNFDMFYNQIESLPIFDLPNDFDLENPELFLPDIVMKKIFGRFVRPRNYTTNTVQVPTDDSDLESSERSVNPTITTDDADINKKLLLIEFSISIKNSTDEDIFVSTHDAVLKINGKQVDSYIKRRPICLFVIKPTEHVSLRAEANLGIADMHAAYEATINAYYHEITLSKYNLFYETLGQLDNISIFKKSCIILKKKLENLKVYIKSQYSTEPSRDKMMILELYGENNTLGNLLTTGLQKCTLVKQAGYMQPHLFINKIIINYSLIPDKKGAGPIKVLTDTIDYLIKIFDILAKSV